MHKARASLLACLPAIGSSPALALLLVVGCANGTTSGNNTCASGQTSCDNACVDTNTSAQHCGSCGNSCSSGQACVNGSCGCASGNTLCGSACVSLTGSHDNCGTCGHACTSSQVCSNGTCGTSCSGTQTACSGNCVDLKSDANNCNACGHACTGGTVCNNGTCACGAGQVMCSNGTCASSCPGTGTGGTTGGGTGGTTGGGTGGTTGGGTGGKATGGTTGGGTGGTTGGGTGGMAGGNGCANTNTGVINEDASGYVCNNTFGIKGAWYCYTDGSDTSSGNSCKGSDGKGAGAIPWNATAGAMCLSGTMGTGAGKFAGIGFKVNSGPPGSTAAPGTYNASSLVGFAITLVSGASGMGTNGMVLNLEYPTPSNLSGTGDAPGVTLPGVGNTSKTYNVLFADSVLANSLMHTSVDPTQLTDVKVAFFPDSVSHTFDFCIKSVVPLMAASNPVVATGAYGPSWTNLTPQAVNGINGYAVQSAPFPANGNPMTMLVNATAGGVGFSYMAGGGFQAPNNGPGSFPAVISGWGPGHDGVQFYGPYKGGRKISQLTSVKSNWTFTMGSTGDAVYDVWFSNSAVQPPAKVGIELMVWIGNTGKMPLGTAVTNATAIGGRVPYVGTNGTGETVVSYWIPSPGVTSVSNFDLLQYFKDAASPTHTVNGQANQTLAGLTTDSVLLGIQTGFEVYSGNWTTTDYNISIQ